MEPLKKLLRVTPKPILFVEGFFLACLLMVGSTGFIDHNLQTIKTTLNLSMLSVLICFLTSHFQIRHTPYLLIQPHSPYEYIRTFLGLTLLRSLIVYLSFGELAYVSPLILLVRNLCFVAHLFAFVSFSFSLNPKIQFFSTRNGKLNLNYIIQATLILALFIIIIAASYSEQLMTLNIFGAVFLAIIAYITFKIGQSLRIIRFSNSSPKAFYLLTYGTIYITILFLSTLRVENARSPIEVSLWQSFYRTNLSQKFDLKRSMDFISQNEISCGTFFPKTLIHSCRKTLKAKFMSTRYPNTNHPEFYTLIRQDREVLEKYAYFYLESTPRPVPLNELWSQWVIESADLKILKKLVESSDTIATIITTTLVESTPERPEIAQYLTAETVSRFADTEEVAKAIEVFLGKESLPLKNKLQVWQAWNKISSEKLQPQRLPASKGLKSQKKGDDQDE